jgi:hypothetical protein
MKDFKIDIPKPCHEDWDKMTPAGQGRHCVSCETTVVDFSEMSATEIQVFFKERTGKKICGNFKASQLDEKLSGWQKFLILIYERIENKFSGNIFKAAALISLALLMNLSGCKSHKNPQITGKVKATTPIDTTKIMILGIVVKPEIKVKPKK